MLLLTIGEFSFNSTVVGILSLPNAILAIHAIAIGTVR
jgi:hypothetical protein